MSNGTDNQDNWYQLLMVNVITSALTSAVRKVQRRDVK